MEKHSMKTKICLINPPTSPPSTEMYFPMALVTLGSFLQAHEISVEIIDFDLELRKNHKLQDWSYFKDYALQRLSKAETNIFGISSICLNYPSSLLLAKEIRDRWPSAKIILGGPQPSAVPEGTLRFWPWIDAIVIG